MVIISIILCILFNSGSSGQILMSQTPKYMSVALGDSLSISCKASSNTNTNVDWYHQTEGNPIKLIIYGASSRPAGISDRITGSGSGTSFTLTIRDMKAEDIGIYHCMQRQSYPLTQ